MTTPTQQPSAPSAGPAAVPFAPEDPVTVPRGLLGAACAAIDRKRDAPKTLAELRRYTVGDLSGSAPQQTAPKAASRCQYCDDTGDVHSITGEWRGVCHCPAGQEMRAAPQAVAAVAAVAVVRRAHAGGRARSIGHQVCDLLPGANVMDGAKLYATPPAAPVPTVQPLADSPWRKLYRRAINEANGLTNYVEDRPELRGAERRLAAIEAEARTLAAWNRRAPPAAPPVPADVLRDALRYRWLKDANALVDDLEDWPHITMSSGQWDAPIFSAEADAAVDAAIAAAPLAAAQPVPATGAQPQK